MLSMVFVALLARAVGPAGLGQYYFSISIIALFMILPEFGFNTLLIRDCARSSERRNELIANIVTWKLSLLLITVLLLSVFSILRGYDGYLLRILFLILLSTTIDSWSNTLFSIFRAVEKMEMEAGIVLGGSLLKMILGITAIEMGLPLAGILVFVCIADATIFCSTVILIRRTIRPVVKLRLSTDKLALMEVARSTIPFGILGSVTTVFGNTDTIMIARMVGDEAVGWYSAAGKIFMALNMIPGMFISAVFPVFSRLSVSDSKSLQVSFRKSYCYLFIAGLLVGSMGFTAAEEIVMSIYGAKFDNSILVFRVMSLICLFNYVGSINGITLNAIGRESLLAKVQLVGVLSNIVLDYVLIRMFGFIGACYSTLLLAIVGFVLLSAVSHKQLGIRLRWKVLAKTIISALIMVGVIVILQHLWVHVFIIIPLAVTVYVCCLILLKAIPQEDLKIMKALSLRRAV